MWVFFILFLALSISATISEKTIEDLSKKIRLLENENLGLKRAIPRLQDMGGKDVTEEVIF